MADHRSHEQVTAYVMAGAGLPFCWGACDCAVWACGWVREACGIDVAAAFRGTYRTRIGAARKLNKRGGFVQAVTETMETGGLTQTQTPEIGDIGVIQTPAGLALGIKVGFGWAAKADLGAVVSSSFDMVRAWSVPCRRS